MSEFLDRFRTLRGYAEQFANWAPGSAITVAEPLRSADGRRFSVNLPNELTIKLAEFADDATLEITRLRASIAIKDKALRADRQKRIAEWCAAAFGSDHATNIEQRGLRLAEESIEAAQAANCDPVTLHKLIDYIYAKEPGALAQELGGVGLCVLAMANAAGIDADEAEQAECDRVLSKPLEFFAARNKIKNDAGFVSGAYRQPLAAQALHTAERKDG